MSWLMLGKKWLQYRPNVRFSTTSRHPAGIGGLSCKYCPGRTFDQVSARCRICICSVSTGRHLCVRFVSVISAVLTWHAYMDKHIIFNISRKFINTPPLHTACSRRIYKSNTSLWNGKKNFKSNYTVFMSSKNYKSNTKDSGD